MAGQKRPRGRRGEANADEDDIARAIAASLASAGGGGGSSSRPSANRDKAAEADGDDGDHRGGALDGLTIVCSGSLSQVRSAFQDMIREHGGSVANSVGRGTTHLVTTTAEAENPTRKVLDALAKRVHIVSEAFITASLESGAPVDEAQYLLLEPEEGGGGAAAADQGAGRRAGAGKRKTGAAAGGGVAREVLAARGSAAAVPLTSNTKSEDFARTVMLADKYSMDSPMDPTGWWISEKLDGVRAYWDGSNFYSRNGNQFPAPAWFKAGLPTTALDGELWCGRRQFRRCLSIVRNRSSGVLWEYITFLVFDAPCCLQPFEQRVEHIKKTVVPVSKDVGAAGGEGSAGGRGTPYAAPVGMIVCKSRAHLKAELDKALAKGGEGLMLRKPGSMYEHKRSKTLLKVKPSQDEEAKVVGHEGGKGQNAYRLGALTLLTPDGRRFSCGTGLTNADRASPPAIGSVVTYRYTELMDNGYPRFPVFVGLRLDLSWDQVCMEYSAPDVDAHKAGALKREHSILYAPPLLVRSLSQRVLPDDDDDADRIVICDDKDDRGKDAQSDRGDEGAPDEGELEALEDEVQELAVVLGLDVAEARECLLAQRRADEAAGSRATVSVNSVTTSTSSRRQGHIHASGPCRPATTTAAGGDADAGGVEMLEDDSDDEEPAAKWRRKMEQRKAGAGLGGGWGGAGAGAGAGAVAGAGVGGGGGGGEI